MNIVSAGLLLCVSIMLAMGQLLFRYGARSAGQVQDLSSFFDLILSPVIIGAVALYGVATIFYVIALQRVPLVLAYPFMALGFIIVPLGAMFFLGEPVTWRYAAGVVLILAGMFFAIS
jgi:undecaprenyl phosphate-alpha-L-ara4N flippase subunit ArnE